MTVVDRLSVADDDRNKTVWTPVLDKGRKTNVCWTIDTKRWKETLLSALN
jgi:hypothetical protein